MRDYPRTHIQIQNHIYNHKHAQIRRPRASRLQRGPAWDDNPHDFSFWGDRAEIPLLGPVLGSYLRGPAAHALAAVEKCKSARERLQTLTSRPVKRQISSSQTPINGSLNCLRCPLLRVGDSRRRPGKSGLAVLCRLKGRMPGLCLPTDGCCAAIGARVGEGSKHCNYAAIHR